MAFRPPQHVRIEAVSTFDDVASVIRGRRTSMVVDPERDIAIDTLRSLCELAQWAPNHKRTWPWRFAVFVGAGRTSLGQAIVADMRAARFGDERIHQKTRTKYLRTPAVLIVGASSDSDAVRNVENRDAVAAGVQNILLAATSMGLASYWGSAPREVGRRTLDLCGFDAETRIVSIIYLGWATNGPAAPARPPVRLAVIDR